ncbi:MAG: glycosyltransferase family 39 protein, partial [Cyanobacteria bacterium REEB65]|nr:glycosyltransferase family 39 protein [Cyanobacteria bacterium REEB65]
MTKSQRALTWLPHVLLVGVLAIAVIWAAQNTTWGMVGLYNDDGSYLAFAKAMAAGKGYVIPWTSPPLPAERFPIGFPAFLSLFFLFVHGSLAQQVVAMQVAVNLLGAAFLACAYAFIVCRLGISPWIALGATATVAVNPMYSDLASTTMSDLPFALLFVAAWWLHQRYMESPTVRRLVPAAVVVAMAILVRYAAAILPLVTVGILLGRRQWKRIPPYGLAVALPLLPWVAWVVHARLFGYASQWAHQTSSAAILLTSLAFSAGYMVYLGLAAFVFPGVYLAMYPFGTPLQWGNPAYLTLGALAVLALAIGAWLAWRKPKSEGCSSQTAERQL